MKWKLICWWIVYSSIVEKCNGRYDFFNFDILMLVYLYLVYFIFRYGYFNIYNLVKSICLVDIWKIYLCVRSRYMFILSFEMYK